jgi:hypothetical protein
LCSNFGDNPGPFGIDYPVSRFPALINGPCVEGFYTDVVNEMCRSCPAIDNFALALYLPMVAMAVAVIIGLAVAWMITGRGSEKRADIVSAAADADSLFNDVVEARDNIAQAASKGAALMKIQLPHVQMITFTWSLGWKWPAYIITLRETVGAFFNLNLVDAAKPECLALLPNFSDPSDPVFLTGGGPILSAIVLVGILCAMYTRCGTCCCCAAKGAWRAHVLSFGVVLYAVAFPALVMASAKWLDWSDGGGDRGVCTARAGYILSGECSDPDYVPPEQSSNWDAGDWDNDEIPQTLNQSNVKMLTWVIPYGFIAFVLVVAVPAAVFKSLRRARNAGTLHSAEYQARLGWFYQSYTDEAYFFELLTLEGRAALIFIGILLSADSITAQLSSMLVVGGMLVVQVRLKPFIEEEDGGDAAVWWSSLNSVAATALVCQLVGTAAGLASTVLTENELNGTASDVLITLVGLIVLLLPTGLSIASFKQTVKGLVDGDGHQDFTNPMDDVEDSPDEVTEPETTIRPRRPV